MIRVDNLVVKKRQLIAEVRRYSSLGHVPWATLEGRKRYVDQLVGDMVLARIAQKSGLGSAEERPDKTQPLDHKWLASLYRVHLQKEANVPMAPIQKELNAVRSKNKTEVLLSHVLLTKQDDAKKAQGLLRQGKAFADVAKELSVDKNTVNSGGSMGWVLIDGDDDPAAKIIRDLKLGQTSGIVKTFKGYEIFQKNSSRIKKSLTPEALAGLRRLHELETRQIEEAKKTMKIEINQAFLEDILQIKK